MRRLNNISPALGYILIVVVSGLLIPFTALKSTFARFAYDIPFLFHSAVPSNVVMIYFDPDVKQALNQPKDKPLRRSFYTKLIQRLTRDQARLIFIDVI